MYRTKCARKSTVTSAAAAASPGSQSPSCKVFYLFKGCCWPTCNKMKVKYTDYIKILVFLNK